MKQLPILLAVVIGGMEQREQYVHGNLYWYARNNVDNDTMGKTKHHDVIDAVTTVSLVFFFFFFFVVGFHHFPP